MWKDDNDKMDELYTQIKEIKRFPTICPICKKEEAHIYMDMYNVNTGRGGIWIWCSACFAFSHFSICVPEYWENCSAVESEKLSAVPIYLNEIKDIVDLHVNRIIQSL